MKWIYYSLLTIILTFGLFLRFILFEQVGGDYNTYKDAVIDFNNGINPYIASVDSYEQDTGEHGYAYFPTLLYILWGIWKFSNLFTDVTPSIYLWKLPTILCELGIFYLILKNTKHKWLGLLLGTLWLFNPYLISRFEITYFDPIFLFILALAVESLKNKNSFSSGLFLALSVSLKTIPIIFIPLFFLLNKDRRRFLFGFGLTFLLTFIPFATSMESLSYVLRGSLFVHGDRALQGRPILFFLGYFLKISTLQDKLVSSYAILSLLLGMFIPLILYFKYKILNIYALIFTGFTAYILITPVLSRTHLIWPFVFLLFFINSLRFSLKTTVLVLFYWLLTFSYLLFWQNGFLRDTSNSELHLSNDLIEWNLIKTGRHKYYEYRDKL